MRSLEFLFTLGSERRCVSSTGRSEQREAPKSLRQRLTRRFGLENSDHGMAITNTFIFGFTALKGALNAIHKGHCQKV